MKLRRSVSFFLLSARASKRSKGVTFEESDDEDWSPAKTARKDQKSETAEGKAKERGNYVNFIRDSKMSLLRSL